MKFAYDKGYAAALAKFAVYSPWELEAGFSHEQEHKESPEKTKKIVKEHLNEDPRYYEKLEKAMPDKTAAVPWGRVLPGAALGGLLFGLPAAGGTYLGNKMTGSLEGDEDYRSPLSAGLGAGAVGALFGGLSGYKPSTSYAGRSQPSRTRRLDEIAPWMKGARTKAEAKSMFRQQARQNHPDMGGSTQVMQGVLDAWEAAQRHPDYLKMAAFDWAKALMSDLYANARRDYHDADQGLQEAWRTMREHGLDPFEKFRG
jgi:hypothetical protein